MLPVAGWGRLDGAPLGPVEAGAIAFVWWVWAAGRRISGAAILTALLVVKLVLGALLVERGFAASYYANDSWTPPVERSLDFRRGDVTRIDRRIAFGNDDQPDLPLHFFNELRFNYFQPDQPSRDRLAYSVEWSSYIEGDGRVHTFYIDTSEGIHGQISVDGRAIVMRDDATKAIATVALAKGWHPVAVRISAPYGAGRRIEAGEIVDGVRHPFDERGVYVTVAGAARRAADRIVRWVAVVVDGFVLASLFVAVAVRARAAWRDGGWGRLLFASAIVEALLFALPRADRVVVLSGGDDWLIYESYARSIVLGDFLLGGATAGNAYYAQVLYPYMLAPVHLLTGDALFGPLFVQRVLIAAATAWIGRITASLFGARAGWIGIVGGGFVVYGTAGRWAGVLLTEAVFVPLLVLWIWLLVQAVHERHHRVRRVVLAGVVGGMATLVRATLMLGWVLMLPAWAAALRVPRRRFVALLVSVMIAIVSLATVRNWIVTRGFVPVTSSFGMALYIGNTPPHPLEPVPEVRASLYRRVGVDGYLETVSEYAFQQPAAFVDGLARKAVYSLGLFDVARLTETVANGTSALYVGTWCLAIIGGILALRRRQEYEPLVLVPALAAISHFVTIVVFYPMVYGDRLLLAMYQPLIPYAAFAVEPVVAWIRRYIWSVAPFAAVALVGCIFAPVTPANAYVTAGFILAAAVLALAMGPRPSITRRGWLYIAYACSVVLLFALSPHLGVRMDFRRELLFPIVAFAVARMAQHQATRRAIAASLVVGAVISLTSVGWGLRTPQFASPDFGDLSRDVARIAQGQIGAREELAEDLKAEFREVPQSFQGIGVVADAAMREIGTVGAGCLVVLWLQLILATRRDSALMSRIGIRTALLVPAILVFAEGMPLEWSGTGYPFLALAVLFGLAETRVVHERDSIITAVR